ncbi:MAG: hypothetical protein ASARMPRED_004552 [Alectoria sarmentosa]|nr:MAG: hypothetical protein ASARMPRED_004552 [Alectoria sarmentosa]
MEEQTVPSYNPPSYESVVAEVHKLSQRDPTTQQIQSFVNDLDLVKKDLLAQHAASGVKSGELEMPELTPKEKEVLSLKFAQFASSEEGQKLYREYADKASAEIVKIDATFVRLYSELLAVDDTYFKVVGGKKLSERLNEHREDFNKVVTESRDLATDIANYAETCSNSARTVFEDALIPLLNDETQSNEKKANFAGKFVEVRFPKTPDYWSSKKTAYMRPQDAERFEEKSTSIQEKLNGFVKQFSDFVNEFRSWAKPTEDLVGAEIKQLKTERDELFKKMQSLQKRVTGLSIATGLAVFGTCLLCLLCPLAIPAILVGGAFVAGGLGIAALGVNYELQNVTAEWEAKKNAIEKANKTLKDIAAARERIVKLGTEDIISLHDSIGRLCQVWKMTHNHARDIQNYMRKGKQAIENDIGETTIRIFADKSVKLYATMAVYLRAYADGTQSFTATTEVTVGIS